MQPNARMTFRFDPPKAQTRPPEARPQPVMGSPITTEEPLAATDRNESSQQGGTATKQAAYYMGGPLQDDLYTLEEMIRRPEPIKLRAHVPVLPLREIPAEPGDTEAEWKTGWSPVHSPDDPAEEVAEQSPAWLSGALIRREGPSWWRVFGSIAAAVATGALFGYLVLTLFTGKSPLPTRSGDTPRIGTPAQATANSAAAGVSRPQAGGTRSADPGDAASAQTTAVSESSFYLLQYGVFRTEASMNAAVQELTNKGLPHAVDRTDGFRVYAGAAATKEEAQRLAGLSGIEVYLKPVVGGAVDTAGAEWAPFIDRCADLIRLLSRLSVDTLQQVAAQPIDMESLKTLRQSHRLWLQSIPGDAILTGPSRQPAKTMESALSAAMVSVDHYTRKMSKLHLWDIQSHVTQAILADLSLRATVQHRLEK